MPTADDPKLPQTSRDVNAERLARLRELFPEAFTEGKLDLRKLPPLLGEAVTDAPERYGLSWAGKSDAIRNIQTLTTGTLLPCPEESWPPGPFAFDPCSSGRESAPSEAGASQSRLTSAATGNESENLIIEGDNLEVLKLLQGGYHGRVKMIYIDPPYNTGHEFIYPDNYKEGLADYLRFSGQVSGEGIRLTTNAETDGRYHSKWLTMMYPRLFLARNLLREDGVIFVSIDDHEVHNLRAVMNEIFGEENFVANIVWEKKFAPQNDAKYFSDNHDHIVLYARGKGSWQRNLLPRTNQANERFQNPDNDARGPWASSDLLRMEHRDNSVYTITSPTGKRWTPEPGTSWRHPQDEMEALIASNEVWFGPDGKSKPRRKRFLKDVRQGIVPQTLWTHEECGHNQEGTQAFKALFEGAGLEFNNPKPVRLLQYMLKIASVPNGDALILDFFAGSGTTAQAVLELNAQDGGNRRFILVQLPEPTGRADFPTIADITKERVRRVIRKLEAGRNEAQAAQAQKDGAQLELGSAPAPGAVSRVLAGNAGASEQPNVSAPATPPELPMGASAAAAGAAALPRPDQGFKVFKLAASNFKVWDAATAPTDAAGLAAQLQLMADNIVPGRPDEALLYELILKSNLPLTSKVRRVFPRPVRNERGEGQGEGRSTQTTSSPQPSPPSDGGEEANLQPYYDVADGTLAVCLARPVTQETLRSLIARKPKCVICLDVAFAGNDQLKANIVLEMKAHGIEFHTA